MKKKKSVSDETLFKVWRKIAHLKFKEKCQICGRQDLPTNLEVHHPVHRRHRLLRFDPENQFLVHSPRYTGKDCHKIADTLLGRDKARNIIGEIGWGWLKVRELMDYKQYLVDTGMTDNENRKEELRYLKEELDYLESGGELVKEQSEVVNF